MTSWPAPSRVTVDGRAQGHPQLASGLEDVDAAVLVRLQECRVPVRRLSQPVDLGAKRDDLRARVAEACAAAVRCASSARRPGAAGRPSGPRSARTRAGCSVTLRRTLASSARTSSSSRDSAEALRSSSQSSGTSRNWCPSTLTARYDTGLPDPPIGPVGRRTSRSRRHASPGGPSCPRRAARRAPRGPLVITPVLDPGLLPGAAGRVGQLQPLAGRRRRGGATTSTAIRREVSRKPV